MPYDFTKSQSTKPDTSKSSKSSSSASSRPSLGTGTAEKAAKALEARKKTIDKQLEEYGA